MEGKDGKDHEKIDQLRTKISVGKSRSHWQLCVLSVAEMTKNALNMPIVMLINTLLSNTLKISMFLSFLKL